MPAPAFPVQTIDDDDDGFDWEAAVREIDVVCTTNLNTISNNTANKQIPLVSTTITTAATRQSTLDHFIVRPRPRLDSEPVFDANNETVNPDGRDERRCCVDIDAEAAKTWIYPVNVPLRDYQYSITKTALFSNTLVALPTGLGKTLIAAVVMYNYFRWFPEGKIVFTAPSKPLVTQQIEACHNIVGIPQEWTIDMTGQISPGKRASLWKSKRVFFVTPQVLEKDIQSGTCTIQNLVCLVIDEAHRAMGNYAYSVAVRELMAASLHLRILALSATPGSKQQTIQQVIDNLHISTLEYRDESDPDVSPYVHHRKLEPIVVPMGKDADDINNLLSEVIRPFVTKLSGMGVPQYRDFQSLSPCELLNARDKFREGRPPNLSEPRCREVEGYFGVLITLYHIRKLLSSHGIKPAYEMLEEKSQQSYFARLLSRNEDIHKTKLLMQKSLSRGAPSPKLSKLTDVLVDHFKFNNPQSSKVIIFSNFRGSVRDIMNTLGKIGEHVKATEFIGQSAGKLLKGQTQKVQQAVLEKFRAGGFNVIVATSIGEEGLDIMEVDLVICFDANISPLRMTQRMGRTGRKNDGRVVVLACEGPEYKGYMRKQAKSKAIGKLMQNGGVNSFRFHSSPRMIPHVFKPEVQLVELSIEQYVRRGRIVTDDPLKQNHAVLDSLTDGEVESITKYFHPNRDNRLRLSLIAFPHFQVFPSRVHKVNHSFRTGIFIDSMQQLQEIPLSEDRKTFVVMDKAPADQCAEVDTFEQHAGKQLKSWSGGDFGSQGLEINTKLQSERNMLYFEVSSTQNVESKGNHNLDRRSCKNPPAHSFLFGSEFVSVDAHGMVQILSIPYLSVEESPIIKYANTSLSLLVNCKQEYLTKDCKELTSKSKDTAHCPNSSQPIFPETKDDLKIHQPSEGRCLEMTENVLRNKSHIQVDDDTGNAIEDTQLSPGLNNFIKIDVVPESPLGGCDLVDSGVNDEFFAPDVVSPIKLQTELPEKSSAPSKIELVVADLSHGTGEVNSPINVDFHSPVSKKNSMMGAARGSPFLTSEKNQSPLDNLTSTSCSRDWLLSSGEKTGSVERRSKFKRLRKLGDSCNKSTKRMKRTTHCPIKRVSSSCADSSSISKKHGLGNRNAADDVRAYLEDEAEVSSDAGRSDDEEEEEGDSFDECFIDDRINSTAATTQAEGIDMMAVYRRSLLSQSPAVNLLNSSRSITPSSAASENGSSSGKTICSLVTTPQTQPPICKPVTSPKGNDFRTENLQRKTSFHPPGNIPVVNLTEKFLENEVNESSGHHRAEKPALNGDPFYDDDQFYASIDLDAIEAQAALLFKKKTAESSLRKQEKPPELTKNIDLLGSPSFDLGF